MRIFAAFLMFFLIHINCAFSQAKWSLQECIDYAYQNNIIIQQSNLNVERSDVNLNQNKYNLLPSLNAGGSHGYNWGQRIDPFTNQFATNRVQTNNFFLSGDLNLFSGFQTHNSIKQSKLDLEASRSDYQKIKNDVALQVCLAYLQVLLNKETTEVARTQVELTTAQKTRVQALVDAGQSPRASLFEIESQIAQEEFTLVSTENQVNIALLNLVQLLQLKEEQAQNFDIVEPVFDNLGGELIQITPGEVYNAALTNMPEVKAAELRRESSEYGLDIARGTAYPRLSLSGTLGTGFSGANIIPVGEGRLSEPIPIGLVSGTEQQVISQTIIYDNYSTKSFSDQLNDNFNQNLTISLSIPIFNGLSTRSNISRAKINNIESELNYRSIRDQLRFDVQQAYADALGSLNQYRAAEKAVAALEESFKYAEVRYEQKVINSFDYNDTKTRLASAQSDLLRAKYDYVFRTKILDFYQGKEITLN